MKETYEKAITWLLEHEGGYTNHPKDPGGPTNYGITHIDLARWRKKKSVTAQDVKNMSLDEAKAIYRAWYWDAVQGDALPAGIDYCIFDYGVNSGVSRSAKLIQSLVHVSVDGKIGPVTIRAINLWTDQESLINVFQDKRLAFLKSLKTWAYFGRGWGRRVEDVRKRAIHLTRQQSR